MSDSEDLVTKVPDRLLERLVSLFLHQKPSAEYRVMLIAAGEVSPWQCGALP